VTSAFNRPNTATAGVLPRESKRLPVTVAVRRHRPLRDKRADRRGHHRQHVLVSVRVDADHVIQLVCNHPV